MKYFLSIIIIYFFSAFTSLSAQQSNLDFCDIVGHSLVTKTTDSVDHLLMHNMDNLSVAERAELYYIRGRLHVELNKKDIKKRAESTHLKLKNAYQDLTRAVDLSPDENHILKYRARRYGVLSKYKPRYSDYESDLEVLAKNGHRKDRTGLGITVVTKFDGEFWIGAEGSLFSGYAPTYKVKDKNGDIVMQKELTVSASAFILGYARNLDSNLDDFSFSLLRIEAPLFIELLKFGYISQPNGKNLWYYRPEIGIGYSYFLLSGAYNAFFDGEAAESISQLQLNFRVKYTF